jgi:cytochrome c peroxidase
LTVLSISSALAQLESLRTQPVPEPANLAEFIQDRNAAIALGKALFWDSQVGSDGVTACASCHFHAGADSRAKNQLSPGLLAEPMDTTLQVGGLNYTLRTSDFPFHQLKNVDDRKSTVLRSSNDVVSSQGAILENFLGLDSTNEEIRTIEPDPLFNIHGLNTRQVEPRNAPTVINAVFYDRNFWDGRAQSIFNGVNPFGLRDSELPDTDPNKAFVWKVEGDSLVRTRVALDNSSLASQAVGPALSTLEMSAVGRQFPMLGRKLLDRRALAYQEVHREDSVLGNLIHPTSQGLNATYREMIQAAFRSEWWGGAQLVPFESAVLAESANTAGLVELSRKFKEMKKPKAPKDPKTKDPKKDPKAAKEIQAPNLTPQNDWTHMEANFSLYFGLALQLYQATLVSDQTPYDQFAEGDPNALTDEQKHGLEVFLTSGKCVNCHSGPEFTNASVANVRGVPLERMLMGDARQAVYDNGFYNIGVRPTSEDLGLGAQDPYGNPLSESRLASLRGTNVFELLLGFSPNIQVQPNERVTANGAFKTPTLRNIELTAPYFHNGGTRTLLEVVEFYNRGGDFFDQNIADVDADMENLHLSTQEKNALVAFMKALTDERVRHRRAPFDHPALAVPNGHIGGTLSVESDGFGAAKDEFILLPATGRNGGVPFRNFLE